MMKLIRIILIAVFVVAGAGCDEPESGTTELSSRLVGMTVPDSPELARSLGCALLGHHVGSSLGSLLSLSGGLDRFFEVDYYGEVAVIILAQTEGWDGSGDGPFALSLYEGQQNDDLEFTIPKDTSGVGGRFDGMALDPEGWFSIESDLLYLPVPILDDWVVYPPLVSVSIEGKFVETKKGFDTERLLLKGYVDDEGVMFLVKKVIEVCGKPEAERPNICPVISNLIRGDTPPEEAFPIFVSFMGGFDTKVADGHPIPCTFGTEEIETDCNAISVCMVLEMKAETVAN